MQEGKPAVAIAFRSIKQWACILAVGLGFAAVAAGFAGHLRFLVSARAAADQPLIVLGKIVPLPNTVVEVQSPDTGRIISPRETPYTIGDKVKKGDPVAIIENRYNLHDAAHLSMSRWDLLTAMLEARDAAVESKVAREKAERLLRIGTVSGQQVSNLQKAEMIAKAEFDRRKILLDQQDSQLQASDLVRRGLFAPIDGEISFVTFTQGQVINEGVVLFRIVNRKEVGFAAHFPEADFERRAGKTTGRIYFDSLPGKTFVGRPSLIAPSVDPQSRTRDVVFTVENIGEILRYGMIGRLELNTR